VSTRSSLATNGILHDTFLELLSRNGGDA